MTTLTATRVAELPRVNLLPPEIEQATRLANLKKLLGLVVAGTLGLAVLLFFWASGQVSSAQSGLDAAQAENASLQAQAAQYAQVPLVLDQLATKETELAVAMSPEVRISFLMNDLSLTIPQSVRLSTMSITVGGADAATAAATLAAGAAPVQAVGSVTYTGKANSYDAVASWLMSYRKQLAYDDPYVQSITQDTGDTVGTVYTWASTVQMTEAAKSNRYVPKAGQ
ncbi:MAG: hypothetical protein WAN48_04455 [Actinomycetes bacterium]